MQSGKVFISHSHKDQIIAKALVDLLEQAGLHRSNIIASSSPKAQLHTGSPLYRELRAALSDKNTFLIFLLSDNFYSSTVCLNEMGAAWVMDLDFQFMVLPGFSFEKVNGVIMENNPVGISLSRIDDVTLTRLNELFEKHIAPRFGIPIDLNAWTLALKDFINSVEKYKKEQLEKIVFAMDNVESFCIGDNDNDGCRVIRRESSSLRTTARIDFSRTDANLCSIVYYIEQKNWRSFFESGKTLCFEAYCDCEPFQAELELHMSDRNKTIPILITDDNQTYRIPLSQFSSSMTAWDSIKELCVLFKRKHVDHPVAFHIDNLRLEK